MFTVGWIIGNWQYWAILDPPKWQYPVIQHNTCVLSDLYIFITLSLTLIYKVETIVLPSPCYSEETKAYYACVTLSRSLSKLRSQNRTQIQALWLPSLLFQTLDYSPGLRPEDWQAVERAQACILRRCFSKMRQDRPDFGQEGAGTVAFHSVKVITDFTKPTCSTTSFNGPILICNQRKLYIILWEAFLEVVWTLQPVLKSPKWATQSLRPTRKRILSSSKLRCRLLK